MKCRHFWLPHHSLLARNVICAHCGQRRHVTWRIGTPRPDTIRAALLEAIDKGVISSDEVTWGGKKLK